MKTSNKSAVIISSIISKIQIIAGGFFAFMCGLSFLGLLCAEEKEGIDAFFFVGVLIFLFILLIKKGIERGKLIKLFKDYVKRLSVDPTHSIDQLAEGTGTSVDVVKNNLKEMLKKEYFVNAYIDEERNCVVFGTAREIKVEVPVEENGAEVKYVTVTCKGCGASCKVAAGSETECEYCGSKLIQNIKA